MIYVVGQRRWAKRLSGAGGQSEGSRFRFSARTSARSPATSPIRTTSRISAISTVHTLADRTINHAVDGCQPPEIAGGLLRAVLYPLTGRS